MKMDKNKEKVLFHSKPTIWYYLLGFFFPIIFFCIDDSGEVFKNWSIQDSKWIVKLASVFVFFGIPLLLILIRREIKIYTDRIEIIRPTINYTVSYYFEKLERWCIREIYVYKGGGWQTILTLNFNNKKMTFHKIELTSFKELVEILERRFIEKRC